VEHAAFCAQSPVDGGHLADLGNCARRARSEAALNHAASELNERLEQKAPD